MYRIPAIVRSANRGREIASRSYMILREPSGFLSFTRSKIKDMYARLDREALRDDRW